jgi:hypothetical protein
MVIPDTHHDPRFADNPLVTGNPFVSSYMGHPLRAPDGEKIGTLCIADPSSLPFPDTPLLRCWLHLAQFKHPLLHAQTSPSISSNKKTSIVRTATVNYFVDPGFAPVGVNLWRSLLLVPL